MIISAKYPHCQIWTSKLKNSVRNKLSTEGSTLTNWNLIPGVKLKDIGGQLGESSIKYLFYKTASLVQRNKWSFLFQWWWTLAWSRSRTKCLWPRSPSPPPPRAPRVTWPGRWPASRPWSGTSPGHSGTPGGHWGTRRAPWTGCSTPWTRSTATWCPGTGTRSSVTRPDLIFSGESCLEIILTSQD